ncbi:MAG: helix-turn-helix transcriptional regulator [Rhizobiaceae bacterium]
MSQIVRRLAEGSGWKAIEVVCTSGAGDKPYEEQHADHCVALVAGGTFTYRSDQGRAMMTPGALLLGNRGACFECGHEHGRGDRCISFHFSEERWDALIEELQGGRSAGFVAPKLPPRQGLAPLYADAESASAEGDERALEETGLRLAAVALKGGDSQALPKITSRDQKRVGEAIRLIEREADRPITLDDMANTAATSPFHFLRVFRQIAGMTPYQFVLKTRLHRAAVKLRTSDEAISSIALDAGFNDLSTFNRRFRRVMGAPPSAYRSNNPKGRRDASASR